jgi:hypothetical protein
LCISTGKVLYHCLDENMDESKERNDEKRNLQWR